MRGTGLAKKPPTNGLHASDRFTVACERLLTPM